MNIFKKFHNKIQKMDDDSFIKMSIIGHLDELRKRLIIIVVCFFIATIGSFTFVQVFVDHLIQLANGYEFVYIAPAELIMQYVKLAVLLGVSITAPVILYQIWEFLCPGLTTKEKTTLFFALFSGFIFFAIGSSFALFIMIPIMLQFFLNVDVTHTITPMISFANYMSFITSTILTFGIVFQMPVVTMALSQLGLLKPEWLIKSRKVVIVLIFILAAFLTPPDLVSQIFIGIPMIGLYELSVVICKALVARKKKAVHSL